MRTELSLGGTRCLKIWLRRRAGIYKIFVENYGTVGLSHREQKGNMGDERDTPYNRSHHRRDFIIFKAASAVSPHGHKRSTWVAGLLSLHRHALKQSRRGKGRLLSGTRCLKHRAYRVINSS